MGFTRSFGALLRKQLIQKMRSPIGWAVEWLLPIFFIGVCALLYQYAFTFVIFPNTQFSSNASTVHPFSIIPYRVQLAGQVIAVAPRDADNAEQIAQAAAFIANMSAWHGPFSFAALAGGALVNALPPTSPFRNLTYPGFDAVTRTFSSSAAIDNYVKSATYDSAWEQDSTANPKIWAAIVFNGVTSTGALDYTIRMNATATPLTTKVVDTLSRAYSPDNIGKYIDFTLSTVGPPFLRDPGTEVTRLPFPGFMTLQREVDRWWIRTQNPSLQPTAISGAALLPEFGLMASRTVPPLRARDIEQALQSLRLQPDNLTAVVAGITAWLNTEAYPPQLVQVVPFPVAAYTTNTFYGLVLTLLAFVFVIVEVVPNSRLVRGLVLEKETKMREGMKMMGLGDLALYGSHMCWYIVLYHLPLSLIFAAIIRASFFSQTNFIYTFLLFFLFGCASTALMYFVSTLFSKAKTASSVGVIIFIVMYFPAFALTSETPFNVQRAASLLPPTAFSLGLAIIGAFETTSAPAVGDVTLNNFNLTAALGMLVLDTFLYLFLGWYIDATLPASLREFGVPRSCCFCCTRGYWREVFNLPSPKRAPSTTVAPTAASSWFTWGRPAPPPPATLAPVDASFFEAPNAELQAKQAEGRCVSVRGLTKSFKTPDGIKVAVAGLDLDMYEGQIFVLLGRNGAGKTTAISMLTGLLEPTSGSASFFGQDSEYAMAAVRRSLGVCPQHDVLWPELTVKEHLETFAAIKGVPYANVNAEVSKIIAEVGLTEKVNVLSTMLSGGMKRKLSVAIALIGGSKVVFLDEPTSGMDPYSRRSTWNILQNAREGRIVLLTTHFMDEADILGDRIAIMSDGRAMCSGSPHFLKKRYGVGYLLTVVKASGNTTNHDEELLRLLRKHVPEASVSSNVSAEFSVRMPLTSSGAFPAMFAELDSALSTLAVASYGISVTSISDVFLKIATGEGAAVAGGVDTTPDWSPLPPKSPYGPKSSLVVEMPAAVRLHSGSSAGAPEAPEAGGAKAHKASSRSTSPSRALEGGGSSGAATIADFRASARKEQTGCSTFLHHSYALYRKRLAYSSRDSKAICYQLIIPAILIAFGLGLLNSVAIPQAVPLRFNSAALNSVAVRAVTPNPPVPRFTYKAGYAVNSPNVTAFLNTIPIGNASDNSGALSVDFAAATALDSNPFVAANPNAPSPVLDYQRMSAFLLKNGRPGEGGQFAFAASMYGAYLFTNGSYVSLIGPQQLTPTQSALDAPPTNPTPVTYAVFTNTTAFHGAPTFMTLVNSAIARAYGAFGISTANQPLPRTLRESTLFNAVFVIFASFIIIIAFSFVAASTSLYIVREREVSAKHQQLISGVSIIAYWTSNFVFDFLAFCVPAVLAIVLCRVFNIKEFISTDNGQLGALLLDFFLFGLASTTNTYLISFAFKSPSSAQTTILFANIFAILLIAISQFMSQVDSTCNAELSLKYVFALLPSYAFGRNLVTLSLLSNLLVINATCDISSGRVPNREPISALSLRGTGDMLIFLACEFLAYAVCVFVLEYIISKPAWRQRLSPDPVVSDAPVTDDADVVAERARIDAGGASGEPIVIQHLRKVYGKGKKVAVRDLSFAVASGEVFGFLGINGAGKTTTLQILSGDVLPASGTASMAGFDILSQQPSVRRLLGYCPQFDSILELLTVREHLELYSRIKGVPEKDVSAVVGAKIAELDLAAFANKTAGSLSGGNKRKLCVAIALIGDPPIVFLDEPSTGMDPVAKRFMWRVITRVASERKQCSIILTTHSMEEVEALCSRIGIMVGGRLRCLGSAQHLRSRHGSGFAVELRLAAPTEATIAACEHAVTAALGAGAGAVATLSLPQMRTIAAALGNPDRAEQINEAGTGWSVHSALTRLGGAVPLRLFATWWVGEQAAKDLSEHFTGTTPDGRGAAFPGSRVVERQGAFMRLAVPGIGESLSVLFSKLEGARAATKLVFDASLGQTTLESVFNNFAGEQDEEQGAIRGLMDVDVRAPAARGRQ